MTSNSASVAQNSLSKGEHFFEVSCFILDICEFCLLSRAISILSYSQNKVY